MDPSTVAVAQVGAGLGAPLGSSSAERRSAPPARGSVQSPRAEQEAGGSLPTWNSPSILRKASLPHLSPNFPMPLILLNYDLSSVPGNSGGRMSRSKKGPLPPFSDHNSQALRVRSWEHRCLVSPSPLSLQTIGDKSPQSHLLPDRSGLCFLGPKVLASQKAPSHGKQVACGVAYALLSSCPAPRALFSITLNLVPPGYKDGQPWV